MDNFSQKQKKSTLKNKKSIAFVVVPEADDLRDFVYQSTDPLASEPTESER